MDSKMTARSTQSIADAHPIDSEHDTVRVVTADHYKAAARCLAEAFVADIQNPESPRAPQSRENRSESINSNLSIVSALSLYLAFISTTSAMHPNPDFLDYKLTPPPIKRLSARSVLSNAFLRSASSVWLCGNNRTQIEGEHSAIQSYLLATNSLEINPVMMAWILALRIDIALICIPIRQLVLTFDVSGSKSNAEIGDGLGAITKANALP